MAVPYTAKADQERGKLRIPARIFPVFPQGQSGLRVTEEELKASLPDALDNSPDVFLFPALASNSGVDAYFTRMSAKTLANFAQALETGVAFLDSHNTGRLPVGYSYSGRLMPYTDDRGQEHTGSLGMFYVYPGITFGAGHSYATTDDYIKAIRAAIIRDVSVGFFGGDWICDIDGKDYWGGECEHVAGMPYEVAPDTFRIATVTIDDAQLTEVSAVYDGATPGATIQKVEQRWLNGQIGKEEREAIQSRFHSPLPASFKVSMNGLALPTRSAAMPITEQVEEIEGAGAAGAADTVEDAVEEEATAAVEQVFEAEEAEEIAEELEETIRVLKASGGQNREFSRPDALRVLRDKYVEQGDLLRQQAAEVIDLRQQVAGLTPLAEDGRTYREDLIEQTIAEGVRALGEAFPQDVYRDMLTHAAIAHIKQVRQSFVDKAAATFPGGRQTEASKGKGGDGQQQPAFKIPAEAYQ